MVNHLMRRNEEVITRLWDWHVTYYVTASDDGFPDPGPGTHYTVFIIFCFGYSVTDSARKRFQNFFSSSTPIQLVWDAKDLERDFDSHWKRPGVPFLRTTPALVMFSPYMHNDMVLVNVNGGPEITHVGLV